MSRLSAALFLTLLICASVTRAASDFDVLIRGGTIYDGASQAPEGVFLKSNPHPRAYGNFARVLGKYVCEEKALTLPQAVRR